MDLCACDVLARQQANKSIGRLRSSCPTHMSRAHAAKLHEHTAKRDGSANDVWGTLSSGGRYDALVKNKQMPRDACLHAGPGMLFLFKRRINCEAVYCRHSPHEQNARRSRTHFANAGSASAWERQNVGNGFMRLRRACTSTGA